MPKRICSVEDCDTVLGPKNAKGMCQRHYLRVRRHGTTTLPARPTPQERFWAKVNKLPGDGCWEWLGAITKATGYGRFNTGLRRDGRWHVEGTHRYSWELHHGPIPEGLWVLHRCDNPPCCRPDHLFLGTAADNNRDMVAKGRHWLAKER